MTTPTRLKSNVKPADRAEVLSAASCRYCGDIRGPFEVDHVIPLSRGGTNRRSNLACSCVSCNTQKSNFLLHEWIQWRKANGMSWPPVASHPTDPQHFSDYCDECFTELWESTPNGRWSYPARRLSWDGAGYRCYYLCDRGHGWTCWYAAWGYYDDCPCMFCQTCRLEESA